MSHDYGYKVFEEAVSRIESLLALSRDANSFAEQDLVSNEIDKNIEHYRIEGIFSKDQFTVDVHECKCYAKPGPNVENPFIDQSYWLPIDDEDSDDHTGQVYNELTGRWSWL